MEQEGRKLEKEKREEARRAEDLQRQERFMLELRVAQPAVLQTVIVLNHKLPEMRESEDIETFVAMFEAALWSNNIPKNLWKAKLHAHLTTKAKLRIQTAIQDFDSTYDEVKEALLG